MTSRFDTEINEEEDEDEAEVAEIASLSSPPQSPAPQPSSSPPPVPPPAPPVPLHPLEDVKLLIRDTIAVKLNNSGSRCESYKFYRSRNEVIAAFRPLVEKNLCAMKTTLGSVVITFTCFRAVCEAFAESPRFFTVFS
jgi:hypothetical protein